MNICVSIGLLLTLLAGYVSPPQQLPTDPTGNWQARMWMNGGAGLFSDVQSKLKALEAAHEAGVLTDAEYADKKTALEAQLPIATPPMDEATKQKLQALEAAHEAGILSDEEYERKKAELSGQKPQTPQIPLILYRDPQGQFQFQHRGGWNIQALQGGERGVALTRGKAALNIMPIPDGVVSAQQVVDGIAEQVSGQWQNYREVRRGEQKVGGQAAPMVEFAGVNPEGGQAHGQVVAFVSGAKGYVFILIAPDNEPESRFDAIQPVWKTLLSSFALIGKRGKTYRHTAGFSFQHPDEWTVTEQEEIIQLLPPNASSADAGPMELYFLVVEDVSAEGIQRPDDPMILEYLDSQVQSLSPALQRTDTVLPANMQAGKGVVVNWRASGTGGEVIARAFIGIIGNNCVVLIGIGLKELVETRDKDLRQMFATLGVGAPTAPQAGQAASATISPGEVGDPNWGFKFRPPEGWKFQKNAETVILGHDTIAGAIFVLPHTEESLQAMQAEMQSGLTDEGIQLLPTGIIQPLGNNAVAGEYAGIFNGEQVKARGIGTFSPYGGGAYIVAVSTPDKYSSQLSGAADAIAREMQYFKVEVSDLMRHFAGTWATSTTNTLTNMTLAPDGSYHDSYESSYSGNLTDGTFKTGDWAVAGQDQGKGRWTVRGNKQQGTIIIKLADGTENNLEYRVHVEKGQTYWNEYWFNGSLYNKIR